MDDNEIIKFSCNSCKRYEQGTYFELFGDLPSLIGLPKIKCKCGGIISIGMAGKYK